MTVRDGSHLFHLGKRAGLHYSNFPDRHLVFMRIGGPSYLKNCRFLPRVVKEGLGFLFGLTQRRNECDDEGMFWVYYIE
jgi:hypothetical protein